MKSEEEFDPYTDNFNDEYIINSFTMFFNNIISEYYFPIMAINDFCETKREYISERTKHAIFYGFNNYSKQDFFYDIEMLFEAYDSNSILDYFEICIKDVAIEKKEKYNTLIKNHTPSLYDEEKYKKYEGLEERFVNRLNELFQHNNLGYSVVNGIIATKKSDFLHVEAVCKPLTLLINEEFNGPLEEFKKAIEEYTHEKYEDTIIDACKSFESTMKAVLDKFKVRFNHDKANASELIQLLKTNKIFDSFQIYNVERLSEILLSGLPTVRNKKAGHGDGKDKKNVERSYASFAINLAGSNIVFILDRYYEKIREQNS